VNGNLSNFREELAEVQLSGFCPNRPETHCEAVVSIGGRNCGLRHNTTGATHEVEQK